MAHTAMIKCTPHNGKHKKIPKEYKGIFHLDDVTGKKPKTYLCKVDLIGVDSLEPGEISFINIDFPKDKPEDNLHPKRKFYLCEGDIIAEGYIIK